MKTCPACQRLYSDDTLVFCLADGARLLNVSRNLDLDATWRLSPSLEEPAPTQFAPEVKPIKTDEAKPLSTIQYRPELQHVPDPEATNANARSTRSVLPWVFAMVVVLAGAGILIAWIVTRAPSEKGLATQMPSPSPQPTVADNGSGDTSSQNSAKNEPAARNGSKTNSNKRTDTAITAPSITQAPAPTPSKKTTVKKVLPKNPVVQEKKKVETSKPTGEMFIPVKP